VLAPEMLDGDKIWCIGVHIACITSGGKLSKRIMGEEVELENRILVSGFYENFMLCGVK
jgi:hypothetical protein